MAEQFKDIGKNTYSLEHTTPSGIKREVFVGHRKSDDFRPTVEIKPWETDGDNLLFCFDDTSVVSKETNLSDVERLMWIGDGQEFTFNPLGTDKDTSFQDVQGDGVKFAIKLAAKPKADPDGFVRFRFKLENHKNFKFNLQSTLTQQQIDDGHNRPEHVIDSIAVKHKWKRNNYGDKKYTTGKICHIYRPWCRDNLGNFTWGKWEVQSADGAQITEIVKAIPEKAFSFIGATSWLVDATFGTTDKGLSSQSLENKICGTQATSGGVAGTGNSIKCYLVSDNADARKASCCIYDSSTNIVANGACEEKTYTSIFDTLETFAFLSAPTIAATTSYKICAWAESVAGTLEIYYDADGDGIYEFKTYDAWPASFTDDEPTNDNSIWVDYTEVGGGAVAPTSVFDGPLVGPFGGPI